jgi:pyruvate,water dikinase
MFTKNLKKLSQKNTNIAGGKGSSLGEIAKIKILIPSGFVISTNAFDKFLEENSLTNIIEHQLKKINYNNLTSINKISTIISELICSAPIPDNLEKEISKEFKKLKTNFVAIRSSAVKEDSSTASWAGVLESCLNTTEEELFLNIKKCWSSFFNNRAIIYHEKKNFLNNFKIAVIVQKMIDADFSGVVFTVHPVNKNKNQIIIEVCFGLGEAFVSGFIIPDRYIIDKKNWEIIDVKVSEQKKQLVCSLKGGTNWKSVLKIKQQKQKLNNKQIIKLAKICANIEKHYKKPQDIEFVIKNNKFYVVQSRSITTL